MSAPKAPRYWAVIAAAGSGARMRGARPKQYLKLRGRALIEHGINVFMQSAWIEGIVVVLAPGDEDFAKLGSARHWKLHTATGGTTRAESVLSGLQKICELDSEKANLAGAPYVLIHDAARPCVTRDDLERLRNEASDEQGGLLALPVSDTLKRAESSRAAATVDRRELWRAQTPQLFRLDLLRQALEHCVAQGIEVTDEARAMEAAGGRPRLVPGREGNVKVTYPDDLALAEFWLEHVESGR
jgi:2-C-methyl-D-erythritol 4-phosphate cytidylyltransferase